MFRQTVAEGMDSGGGTLRGYKDPEGAGRPMASDRGLRGTYPLRGGGGHWGTEPDEPIEMVSDAKCMGDELDWGR